MSSLGRDTISTTIPSTQSHRMIKVECKIVLLMLMLIPNTFLVHQIRTLFKCSCLTLELFKKSRSLIIVNYECLFLSVSGLMEIPACIKIKWDLLW